MEGSKGGEWEYGRGKPSHPTAFRQWKGFMDWACVSAAARSKALANSAISSPSYFVFLNIYPEVTHQDSSGGEVKDSVSF